METKKALGRKFGLVRPVISDGRTRKQAGPRAKPATPRSGGASAAEARTF